MSHNCGLLMFNQHVICADLHIPSSNSPKNHKVAPKHFSRCDASLEGKFCFGDAQVPQIEPVGMHTGSIRIPTVREHSEPVSR